MPSCRRWLSVAAAWGREVPAYACGCRCKQHKRPCGFETLWQAIFSEEVSSSLTTLKMVEKFPEVQGGGSLILAWQIRNKRVLVVGGGEVCAHGSCHMGILTECRWRQGEF